jgi:hypothetical protein
LLSDFGDKSLPEPGRLDVSRHLRSCSACRRLAERRRCLGILLRSGLPVPEPGDLHFERERARILQAAGLARAPRRRVALALVAGALAAASVLMILKGPALLGSRKSPPVPAPAPAPIVRTKPPVRVPAPEPPPRKEEARAPEKEPQVVPAPPPPAPVPVPVIPEGPAPGTAVRLVRMAGEAVEVALAETPIERVTALCAAAEAQLRELPEAIAKDPALAAELAGAYRLIVVDGVGSVLRESAEPEAELAAARDVAARRARDHEETLAALAGSASGPLKESLGEALAASRMLSGR